MEKIQSVDELRARLKLLITTKGRGRPARSAISQLAFSKTSGVSQPVLSYFLSGGGVSGDTFSRIKATIEIVTKRPRKRHSGKTGPSITPP